MHPTLVHDAAKGEHAPDASTQRHAQVQEYYGKTLQSTSDLKTSACCSLPDTLPLAHRRVLQKIHPEVNDKFYGCGSPLPDLLDGATVLDLGCGTGRDVYLASYFTGPNGRVIGVDMTEQQLQVARKHQAYHAEVMLGPGIPTNVDFYKAYIEDLASAGIHDDSVDVVISNCVLNLAADKKKVFTEIWRVLRRGGELYFADVYADRRLPKEAAADPVLVGECLGGALYLEDFRRIMADVGFRNVRIVTSSSVQLKQNLLSALVADVRFFSVTVRAFKLPELEDRAEEYGQVATYVGKENMFTLDQYYTFAKDVPVPVDANTATILTESRYKACFTVTPRGSHQGLAHSKPLSGFLSTVTPPSGEVTPNCCQKTPSSECCPSVSKQPTVTVPKSGDSGSCYTPENSHTIKCCSATSGSKPKTGPSGCC